MAAELQQRQTAVAAGQEEAFSADAVLQAARQALRELQQEQERQLAAARQRRDAQMAQLAEEQRQQALAQQALQQQARMLDMWVVWVLATAPLQVPATCSTVYILSMYGF
jgi:hypothetical protein